jgi:hypothetical protein
MKRNEIRTGSAGLPEDLTAPTRISARARPVTPIFWSGLCAALGRFPWRIVLVVVGLVVQVGLTLLVWHLIDLTVSLMEVWAELARKHLEILLS